MPLAFWVLVWQQAGGRADVQRHSTLEQSRKQQKLKQPRQMQTTLPPEVQGTRLQGTYFAFGKEEAVVPFSPSAAAGRAAEDTWHMANMQELVAIDGSADANAVFRAQRVFSDTPTTFLVTGGNTYAAARALEYQVLGGPWADQRPRGGGVAVWRGTSE